MSTNPPISLYYDSSDSEEFDINGKLSRPSLKERLLRIKHEKEQIGQGENRNEISHLHDHVGMPTPQPSSSLGNLGDSSPLHENDNNEQEEERELFQPVSGSFDKLVSEGPKIVQFSPPSNRYITSTESKINKRRHPNKKFKKVRLPMNGETVSIGRSSICDVALSDSRNLISRKHAIVNYDVVNECIVVKCFGVNGLEVQTPVEAKVKYLGERNKFELIPEECSPEKYNKFVNMKYKDLVYKGLTKFPRGLNVANGTSKFLVLPNEVLRIPKFPSVVLDIRGFVCVIDVGQDPDMTDDELPPVVELSKMSDSASFGKLTDVLIEASKSCNTPKRSEEDAKKMVTNIVEGSVFSVVQKPTVASVHSHAPTRVQRSVDNVVEKVADKVAEKSTQNQIGSSVSVPVSKMESKGNPNNTAKVQLADAKSKILTESQKCNLGTISLAKIKTIVKQEERKEKQENKDCKENKENKDNKDIETKKRLKSAINNGSNKKHKSINYDFQDPKTLIDAVNNDVEAKMRSLSEINDLKDLKKILINHLAFSRLASTPLTQLKNISGKLSQLSKKDIRLILSDIKCVGVIYRQGKDAAGKPLDEEYYYDVEKDDDEDRIQTVNSLKGGNSLRSCRKKHKQYYWKRPPPLPRY